MSKLLFILILLNPETSFCQTNTPRPGTIGYFLTKAVAMEGEKKYEQAILYTDSAMTIDSNNENIYAVKAEILWMMKRFSEAAETYQKALLLDKDNSYLFGAYLFLGVLYEKAKMQVQAQLQYLKAVYFFENKKRKNDKYFEASNNIDYAIALRLSGNDKAWEKLLNEPYYRTFREVYFGKSREEILEIYFNPFSGG